MHFLFICSMIIILLLLLLDPTLTLPNLTTLLENLDWNDVGWGMDIPDATRDMIHSSGGDDSQCRRRCWEVYLNEHPAPSWKRIASVLYVPRLGGKDYLEELEMVQRKYLRGESAVVIVMCSSIALTLLDLHAHINMPARIIKSMMKPYLFWWCQRVYYSYMTLLWLLRPFTVEEVIFYTKLVYY